MLLLIISHGDTVARREEEVKYYYKLCASVPLCLRAKSSSAIFAIPA